MGAYAAFVLAETPTAYYRLNEASGLVAHDATANHYDGTIKATGVTRGSAGALVGDTDTAMTFGGSGVITLPSGLKTDGWAALTIECWLKFSSTTNFVNLVSNTANPMSSHVGFRFLIDSTGDGASGYFQVGNGTTATQIAWGTAAYATGQWYHLVVVYDGAALNIYENGSLIGHLASTNALSGTIGAAGQLSIGAASTVDATGLQGVADEVAIYHYALSALQIANHYRLGAGKSIGSPTDGQGVYESVFSSDTANAFARLDQIASAGFTLVMNYDLLHGSIADITAYIAHAQSVGLKVIVDLSNTKIWNTRLFPTAADLAGAYPPLYAAAGSPTSNWDTVFSQYVVNQLKNLPGVWGYYVADEPLDTDHTILKVHSDAIKAADSTHPRLIVLGGGDTLISFGLGNSTLFDCCDVGGEDYYPLGHEDLYPLSLAQEAVAVQAYTTSKSIGMALVLQSWSWALSGVSGAPWPTRAQMRAFRDDTLTNSAPRLLLWYDYFDAIVVPPAPASQWADLVSAATGGTRSISAAGALKRTQTRTISATVALQFMTEYSTYKTSIEPNLVRALAANSLLTVVSLIGPDTSTGNDSWLVSSSSDLTTTLRGYSRHDFPAGMTDISSDGQEMAAKSLLVDISANDNSNKSVISMIGDGALGPGGQVTTYQYGVEMADFAVQLTRAGMAAVIAYLADDDMHGTQWGMWQSTATPNTLRPWFFPWFVLSNTLPAGSAIYTPAQPITNDFRVLAAQAPQGVWTFVLINRLAGPRNVQLSVPFAPVATTTLSQYVYAETIPLFVDGNGFPLPSGTIQAVLSRGFTVQVAGNSLVILTQQSSIQTTVFNVKRPPLQKRR